MTRVHNEKLATPVGTTVTTVVFNRVGSKRGPGEDTLPVYRAAQWAAFAFGAISTILGILCFRGVGFVGHRSHKLSSISETEKGKPLDKNHTREEDHRY